MSFLSRIAKAVAGSSSTQAVKKGSASAAKERLSVILASQRNSDLLQTIDMEALQKDVIQVLQQHIPGNSTGTSNGAGNGHSSSAASGNLVSCNMRTEGDVCLFEMSVEVDVDVDGGSSSRNVTMNRGIRR